MLSLLLLSLLPPPSLVEKLLLSELYIAAIFGEKRSKGCYISGIANEIFIWLKISYHSLATLDEGPGFFTENCRGSALKGAKPKKRASERSDEALCVTQSTKRGREFEVAAAADRGRLLQIPWLLSGRYIAQTFIAVKLQHASQISTTNDTFSSDQSMTGPRASEA